ncbi:MAG: tetratricopeptide repeat protein [Gammaproteobacteria bacterium]|nr:tetratricopeptide repeat protein [Gammaproteobacteria bacterium]MDH3372590.1 tetratricopeptide repeat protein [Gammaproteobacteria bacterium]MDH3408761.1 tetratricopeptide repeat protein [Gammaproteobacteria bacterium]MDH3553111.1 tetratricopeptide repeat protein [Gammaproteobacteria bacterium]
MAMTKIPNLIPLTLLLLGAANVNAANVTLSAPAEEVEREISPQTVQEGQIVPVAEEGIDEGVDDPEEMSVPEANDSQTLANEFALFKQLMDDGVLDEADTVAKRIVELAIRASGPQSNEFAKALTNLAIVQHRTEQYDAAQQNFQTAIEIIEDNEDRLNAQLVNPLKGLGAAQLESGRPDLASATFERAVHVTHVNEGPHNLDQIELLESIAETMLRMGDLDAAKEAQDAIYALQVRRHDVDVLGLIPSLMRRAAWQHRAGLIYDERATYRRVIRIIEVNVGKDDMRLVKPLIMLGKSFFYIDMSGSASYQDTHMSSGEIYFKRAARIAGDSPESDWQAVTQANLALGDYYIYQGNAQRGQQIYLGVWELLSVDRDEPRLDVRRAQLESIVPLKQGILPEYINAEDANDDGLQSDDPLLRGKITVAFEISTRGRVTAVELVEADPPEFTDMQRTVMRGLRQRLYRPRFEDAEVMATPNQTLVHTFFYRQSDLDTIRSGAAAAEQE